MKNKKEAETIEGTITPEVLGQYCRMDNWSEIALSQRKYDVCC